MDVFSNDVGKRMMGKKRSKHEVVAQTVTFLPKKTSSGSSGSGVSEESSYDSENYYPEPMP